VPTKAATVGVPHQRDVTTRTTRVATRDRQNKLPAETETTSADACCFGGRGGHYRLIRALECSSDNARHKWSTDALLGVELDMGPFYRPDIIQSGPYMHNCDPIQPIYKCSLRKKINMLRDRKNMK